MIKITKESFRKAKGSEEAYIVRLDNSKMSVDISNYGATIVAIRTPDKNGDLSDITLGYDTVAEYKENGGYFGATVGRYANRIKKGEFTLNGVDYKLAKNDGAVNHLHGGDVGFDKKYWDVKIEKDCVVMSTVSADMEEGYPGELSVSVTFTLTEKNEVSISYLATTTKDTIINLTNHTYFNLSGQGKGDILRHQIKINASKFTRIDNEAIPTGELPNVEETPFDFKNFHAIGERIGQDNADLKAGGGYDHNFCLDNFTGKLQEIVELKEEYTGRKMTVYTDQAGVQLYTGNMITPVKGKANAHYGKRSGLCLETQCYPDTPNNKDFPSCVLKANDTYKTTTVYQFSTI